MSQKERRDHGKTFKEVLPSEYALALGTEISVEEVESDQSSESISDTLGISDDNTECCALSCVTFNSHSDDYIKVCAC